MVSIGKEECWKEHDFASSRCWMVRLWKHTSNLTISLLPHLTEATTEVVCVRCGSE